MINDPSAVQFSDQVVQDRLDENRTDVRFLQLSAAPTLVNTSGVANYIWDTYYAGFQYWESDWVLSDGKFATLTPVSVDEITGKITFTSTAPGQIPPVFITGKVYDIYATAADLLEFWSASYVLRYTFASDGQTFNIGQITTQLTALAKTYRNKAQARTVPIVRSDLANPNTQQPVILLGNNDALVEG
jgi:hypothetical protein